MTLTVGPKTPTGAAIAPVRGRPIHGRLTSIVPLGPEHAPALYKHLGRDENAHRWTYMPTNPWLDLEACAKHCEEWSASSDPVFYVVLSGPASDPASEALGIAAYLNIVPEHRRVEIGSIILSERLKRTRIATEVFYSLIRHAFEDLGYLRVEWKCDHLNQLSQDAAKRLGFTYEGTFRQHIIVKERRRDTAWFSIIEEEWPLLKQGFEAWLDDDNFDAAGKQKRRLQECRSVQ